MVEIEEIERLIALMKSSGLIELSIQSGDYKISLKRSQEELEEDVTEVSSDEADDGLTEETEEELETEEDAPAVSMKTTPVVSPLVGVFHNGGMPDRRKILKEGDVISENQVLAVIESLRVPNEIRAPVSGVLSRILVKDGAGVEFGQTLFLIKSDEPVGEE